MYIFVFFYVLIRKAVRETEEMRTKLAYRRQPDVEIDADDWSNAEEWKL